MSNNRDKQLNMIADSPSPKETTFLSTAKILVKSSEESNVNIAENQSAKTNSKNLQANLEMAQRACDYARQQIVHGCTQIENNKLPKHYFESLDDAVLYQLRMKIVEVSNDPIRLIPDEIFAYERYIAATSKYSLGNCYELALQALDYFLEIEKKQVNVAIFEIGGEKADHVFVVIGLDKSINLNKQPINEDAVICDPWAANVYPASEYQTKLKTFYRKNSVNMLSDFDPKVHTLEKIMTLDELREERKSDILIASYSTRLSWLEGIILDYQVKLEKTKLELIKKYGNDDCKCHIICDKLLKINVILDSIKQLRKEIPEKSEDAEYRKLHLLLRKNINNLLNRLDKVINLNETEINVISTHRDKKSLTGKFKMFCNLPTETEKNIAEANKNLVKAMQGKK